MPFDFPNSPAVGQTTIAPNGALFQWDGAKWITGTGPTPSPNSLFLPLGGGTMTGALNWSSTGSTTSRAAQDRTAGSLTSATTA